MIDTAYLQIEQDLKLTPVLCSIKHKIFKKGSVNFQKCSQNSV